MDKNKIMWWYWQSYSIT